MVRAGAHALTLLSVPLNVQVLTVLEDGPMALTDLRRATGSPPQSTTRKQLRLLTDLGVLERRQSLGFAGTVDYQLAQPGMELLEVAKAAQIWLGSAPGGPLELGTSAAKNSIKAMVDGWTATVVRAIAAKPLSLTQLSRLIPTLNYPSLERRLAAMRLTGQISCAESREGRSRPYAATPWLRRAIGPIVSAARWERQFAAGETTPIMPIDVESTLLLTLPLLQLADGLRGTARIAVEMRRPDGTRAHAGVLARVEGGAVVSCSSRLEGYADAWCSGGVGGWLNAAATGDLEDLEVGGDSELVRAVIDGIHGVLFEGPELAAPGHRPKTLY
jgi:DNA-binding HxlR family transcriptional regulator